MTRHALARTGVLLIVFVAAGLSSAQEDPATSPREDAKTAADDGNVDLNAASNANPANESDYKSLLEKWQAIEKRLASIEMDFYHSPTADRAALSKQFQSILDEEAKPAVAKLRKAAVAEYRKNPNKDEQLLKLLVGMVISDARLGQEVDALEMILLLAEHKCDPKYIDVLTSGKQLSPDALDMLIRLQKRFEDANMPEPPGADGNQ